MVGDRLSESVSPAAYRMAAGTYLLSPYTPLIFMGEEYGEKKPFPYFVHHGEDWLIEAVRKGRAAEFAAFQEEGKTVPDPQSEETFQSAQLSWSPDEDLLNFYREALRLRREFISGEHAFEDVDVSRQEGLLSWTTSASQWRAYANWGDDSQTVSLTSSSTLRLSGGGAQLSDGSLVLPASAFAFVSHSK